MKRKFTSLSVDRTTANLYRRFARKRNGMKLHVFMSLLAKVADDVIPPSAENNTKSTSQ